MLSTLSQKCATLTAIARCFTSNHFSSTTIILTTILIIILLLNITTEGVVSQVLAH